MQHVAGDVERQALLELPDMVEPFLAARLGELLQRLVGPFDVRRVMGPVVQLEQLARDVRLEGVVFVGQRRELVHGGVPRGSSAPQERRQQDAGHERETRERERILVDVRGGAPQASSGALGGVLMQLPGTLRGPCRDLARLALRALRAFRDRIDRVVRLVGQPFHRRVPVLVRRHAALQSL